jgi:hypothetical protein
MVEIVSLEEKLRPYLTHEMMNTTNDTTTG